MRKSKLKKVGCQLERGDDMNGTTNLIEYFTDRIKNHEKDRANLYFQVQQLTQSLNEALNKQNKLTEELNEANVQLEKYEQIVE